MEGGRMLLPGQRFCPMEDELLMYYLKPKVNGKEVPGNEDVICELDLYGDQDPWKIWERFQARRGNDLRKNKDLYFFTQKKKMSATGKRIRRTVGSGGTWKGQNAGTEIYLLDQNQKPTTTLLGFKKSFTYKNKRSVHHGRWIMYEFELDKSQLLHKKQVNKNDYVLCLLRKNDELPVKKRKRLEEEEMLGDSDQDDDEDTDLNNDPVLVIEEPHEKRQRLADNVPAPSLGLAEQKQWFDQEFLQPEAVLEQEHSFDQEFLQPEAVLEQEHSFDHEFLQPKAVHEQEAGPTPLEDEPVVLQVDENSGLQQIEADQEAPPLELAELEQWFEAEFEVEGLTRLEAEQVSWEVDETSGLQQFEDEPQLGEENMEQQLSVPTFSADDMMSDEIMSGLQFYQDEDLVRQMGAEIGIMTQGEVDLYGGNLSDVMVGANWPKSFVEDLMNDDQPNTMEVGDWNAGYLDFGYFEF
ncbi:hypothetical protein M0R45_025651 [Rubus argutus]|uniref:NAC domain-containing protein n=1 Tax=Rubus argutus TaxID=59490 RepID=A0AAW1WWL6_RUBAR